MAYHIFHPNAYNIRFKHDNENFYFEKLEGIILHFWKESKDVIPKFLNFLNKVNKFDKSKIIDDVDEFEDQYPKCNRKFYLDIFPY